MTQSDAHVPPFAAVISHHVDDFGSWKAVFDKHAALRAEGSIIGHHINRGAEDPNLVIVYLPATDKAALAAHLEDPKLKAAMGEAGVSGPPETAVIKPVEERLIRDRLLPAALVRHSVKDFDAWKSVFDAAGELHTKYGIVGHAVNRGTSDPMTVIVYLQAETIDELKSFTASPELKEKMQEAGVEGPPEITFVQGNEWGRY